MAELGSSSVFSSVAVYFRNVYLGLRSFLASSFTALPYLFGLGDLRKSVTEEYPDPVSSRTEDDLPPRSKGFLVNDIVKCTGCLDCQKICPTRAIQIEVDPGLDPAKKWVTLFDIDFSKCVLCGLCVEACVPQSLTHSKRFERATSELASLKQSFGRGVITKEMRRKWEDRSQSDQFDRWGGGDWNLE